MGDEERAQKWAATYALLAGALVGADAAPPPHAWAERCAAARQLVGLLAEELELSHDAERRAELASMQIKAIALSVEARKHALVEELARGSTRRSA